MSSILRPVGYQKHGRTAAAMRAIIDRCFPWSYGNDYVPAALATRNEGASMGRLHEVPMPKWNRIMHLQSAAEMRVAVYVMYQPNFVEGLESRPCSPLSGLPVLDGHPLMQGKPLPFSSGTVGIAKALGYKHPMTSSKGHEDNRQEKHQADYFPLVSKFLAILADGNGVRAVNLFTKKHLSNLELVGRQRELFLIERTLYAESRIPTRMMCEDYLNPIVTNNLVRLAKKARKPRDVSDAQLAEALLYMEEHVFHSAPNTWESYLRENLGLLKESVFHIFHFGVFHRHLKVDLQEAVAMDRVHRRERINFAADFASRFLEPMP